MEGLKVGHFTDAENGTGLSVFLFNQNAVGAYVIAGSSPASHELAPLETEMRVSYLHGLLFTGGSAFGLFAAEGIMRYLAEKNIGIPVPHGVVPIVPAVSIYDLNYKKAVAPNADHAYEACLNATEKNETTGHIGAGTGATVGKIFSDFKRMTSGIGRAEVRLPDGLHILSYAVVNAVGDICNKEGEIIAGAKKADGTFANCAQCILAGKAPSRALRESNTTLVSVFTNAKFTKAELKRLSKMAIAGMGRAISPVFTCYDGDILFSISLGDVESSVLVAGTVAAEVVRLAILDAVKQAEVVT